MSFNILLANTRGMCAGVERAIAVVEHALSTFGTENVYVLHEVVHNKHVVDDLRQKGAHFVDSLQEIPQPETKTVIFSAHGVGIATKEEAVALGLRIIDATCPLVDRIHHKVARAASLGKEAVIIGHEGHQEVVGTIGQYSGDPSLVHLILKEEDVEALTLKTEHALFATQTTLSVDETAKTVAALKKKFPFIEGPKQDDTCFATQHRQASVKILAQSCDVVLVAGSKNSSNSRRLSEVAAKEGCRSYLIDDSRDITDEMLEGVHSLGLTAGASAPEYIVEEIIAFLKTKGAQEIIPTGPVQVHRVFPLPKGLE